ncbi:MAG: DUF2141 domain-containing protein [Rhodospirillales bacterium]|nr:DUF2141 domain-containing protein [Rhodospirillales bacterium]
MVRILVVFGALALLILSATCSAATLEVVIRGLQDNKGDVHIALFNKADHFPYQEGVFKEEKVRIGNNRAELRFEAIAPGDYAIAVYHDANANHEFDQIIFGIPLESFGFSNNAGVFFGPPSFDDARFPVTGPLTAIEIDLRK